MRKGDGLIDELERLYAWLFGCRRVCLRCLSPALLLFLVLFLFLLSHSFIQPITINPARHSAHSPTPDAANRPEGSSRQATQPGLLAGVRRVAERW
jgi:hypothetical protein